MTPKVSNALILIFWLAMMSWLAATKIVPAWYRGKPPTYDPLAQEEATRSLPTCWHVLWNDRWIGWAANKVEPEADGGAKIRSRIEFVDLQVSELGSSWLKNLFAPMLEGSSRLAMRITGARRVDDSGQLEKFVSSLYLADQEEPLFKIYGKVTEQKLALIFRARELDHPTTLYLPRGSAVGDEMSPQGYLPGLWEGRSWTSPVYSPLRLPGNPTEVLVATVERIETIVWEGRSVETWVVVYRRDPGAGSASQGTPQGKMWVRRDEDPRLDGMVLRQEANVFGAKVRFERISREAAQSLATALDEDWTSQPRPPRKFPLPLGEG